MRRTRRLTSSERWELGLFLSLLIVSFLCITAILNLPAFPKLFAAAFGPSVPQTEAPATPAPAPQPGPQIQTAAPEIPSIPVQTVPVPPLTFAPPPADAVPTLPPAASDRKKPAADIRIYNGRKYRFVKTLRLRVTAYSPDSRCCWPYPGTTTASGLSVKTNRGKLVAADTRLIPLHALVSVPGYAGGATVPVLDRGGAIKGYRMDVLLPRFDQAKEWGSRLLEVKIYMPVDE
ncbi:MAG TPA: 3D domain-containing protein [Phycisphaerae bacterium]|nr:3D domain-containing protein [Phycisphaerae bacterium]